METHTLTWERHERWGLTASPVGTLLVSLSADPITESQATRYKNPEAQQEQRRLQSPWAVACCPAALNKNKIFLDPTANPRIPESHGLHLRPNRCRACRRLSSAPGLRGTKSSLDAPLHQPVVSRYDHSKGKIPTRDLGCKPLGTSCPLHSIPSSGCGNKSAFPQMTTGGSCKCSPHWEQKRNLQMALRDSSPTVYPQPRTEVPRPAGSHFSQGRSLKQQKPQEPDWGTSP